MLNNILYIAIAALITIIMVWIIEIFIYISKIKKNKNIFKRIVRLERRISIYNKKLKKLHTSYIAIKEFEKITGNSYYNKKSSFAEYSRDMDKTLDIMELIQITIKTITIRKQEAERERKRLQGIIKVDKLRFKIIARFI